MTEEEKADEEAKKKMTLLKQKLRGLQYKPTFDYKLPEVDEDMKAKMAKYADFKIPDHLKKHSDLDLNKYI